MDVQEAVDVCFGKDDRLFSLQCKDALILKSAAVWKLAKDSDSFTYTILVKYSATHQVSELRKKVKKPVFLYLTSVDNMGLASYFL